jgi:hypothetical protein
MADQPVYAVIDPYGNYIGNIPAYQDPVSTTATAISNPTVKPSLATTIAQIGASIAGDVAAVISVAKGTAVAKIGATGTTTTTPSATATPSTFSAPWVYLLIAGVVILALAVGMKLVKK